VSTTDALRYRPTDNPEGPRFVSEPHRHRWQAVGVVSGFTDAARARITGTEQHWVAQSCECGKVRAVPLLIEDAE
jgi:hypothetical protein